MKKYLLEVCNWGTWQREKEFSSKEQAITHGRANFPENEWRVFDRVAKTHVHHHDQAGELSTVAARELNRFAETIRWRRYFADRAAEEVIAQQEQSRQAEAAQRQREQLAARRRRLEGFEFEGPPPAVLMRFEDEYDDYVRPVVRREYIDEKVNWRKEGF